MPPGRFQPSNLCKSPTQASRFLTSTPALRRQDHTPTPLHSRSLAFLVLQQQPPASALGPRETGKFITINVAELNLSPSLSSYCPRSIVLRQSPGRPGSRRHQRWMNEMQLKQPIEPDELRSLFLVTTQSSFSFLWSGGGQAAKVRSTSEYPPLP